MNANELVGMVALAAAAASLGCRTNEANATTPSSVTASSAVAQAVSDAAPTRAYAAMNTFAFRWFGALEDRDKNLLVSPTSARMALAVLHPGARDHAAAALASTLDFHPDAKRAAAEMETEIAAWRALASPTTELRIANHLWVAKACTLVPSFAESARTMFGAGIDPIDFGDANGSVGTINAWVSQETKARIPKLFEPGQLAADTALVVTNAVYFNAAWRTPFAKDATSPAKFHRGKAGDVTVPMMHGEPRFRFARLDGFEIVELLYRDGTLAMDILLPDAPDGLAALEAKLDAATFARWMDALGFGGGRPMAIPRFEFRAGGSAKKQLAAIGMGAAFGHDANYSGVATGARVVLDDVVQQTFVHVDENGTEAAAATGAVVKLVKPAPPPFVVDHPFLFVVRDTASGRVLFVGHVADPSAS